MSTITKEQLRERARQKVKSLELAVTQTAFADSRAELEEELELARIALASLEAEPVVSHIGSKNALDAIVAFIKSNRNPTLKDHNEVSERLFQDNCHGISNHVIEYIKQIGEELEELRSAQDSAPPAPVSVPDEMTPKQASRAYCGEVRGCRDGWNACRAAMLQGAENAESTTTMHTAPALDSSPKIAESPSGINQGKSEPVTTACKLRDAVEIIRNSGIEIDAEKIFAERDALNAPDCWCRTCRTVTISDMRFVVCPECGNKRCPHANDHRNACTGSNEPGQEGSAYPAAPQQEVK